MTEEDDERLYAQAVFGYLFAADLMKADSEEEFEGVIGRVAESSALAPVALMAMRDWMYILLAGCDEATQLRSLNEFIDTQHRAFELAGRFQDDIRPALLQHVGDFDG